MDVWTAVPEQENQRIDVSQLRANASLEYLVSRDGVTLSEPIGHNERRVGPCPFCGDGQDRFNVYTRQQRFWCRVCHRRGDAIQYVQYKYKMSFVDATKWLSNGATMPQSKPIIHQRPNKAGLSGNLLLKWRENATELITQACENLLYMETKKAHGARFWLRNRGIEEKQIRDYMIGYNEKWEIIIPDYKLPAGLTIPRFNQDYDLVAINVYLDEYSRNMTGQRRMMAKGSLAKSFFNGHNVANAEHVVIAEGELDTALISRFFSSYATAAVTCGGAQIVPDDLSLLDNKKITLVFDNDSAGQAGCDMWLEKFPLATVAKVPKGKDVTDYFYLGGDLQTWINDVVLT